MRRRFASQIVVMGPGFKKKLVKGVDPNGFGGSIVIALLRNERKARPGEAGMKTPCTGR
jgi:hypothetical protein